MWDKGTFLERSVGAIRLSPPLPGLLSSHPSIRPSMDSSCVPPCVTCSARHRRNDFTRRERERGQSPMYKEQECMNFSGRQAYKKQ